MTFTITRRGTLLAWLATLALGTLPAMAQDYPTKPITLVVSYAAGGGTDAIARVFAARLETALGGRVIVENRPGAAANIGTEVVADAAPDGDTLLIGNQGPMVVNPHLFDLPKDPAEALEPIAMITTSAAIVSTPRMASSATVALKSALSFLRLPATPFVLFLLGGKLGKLSRFWGPPQSGSTGLGRS